MTRIPGAQVLDLLKGRLRAAGPQEDSAQKWASKLRTSIAGVYVKTIGLQLAPANKR